MKKIFLFIVAIGFSTYAFSQQEIPEAKVGTEYGTGVKAGAALTVQSLQDALKIDSVYTGKIQGKVIEVCKKKGCFMKLEQEDGQDAIMVRFKDYGFFMPQDVLGKDVVLEGVAKVNETSVAQLQHFAEDAGKSKQEISKITSPKTAIEIIAVGVKVIQ